MRQSREVINQLKAIVEEKKRINDMMRYSKDAYKYSNYDREKALQEYRQAVRNHLKALGC